MKKILAVISSLVLLAMASVAMAGSFRVGTVDYQKVIRETGVFKQSNEDMRERFQAEFDKLKAERTQLMQNRQKLKDDKLSEEERTKLEESIKQSQKFMQDQQTNLRDQVMKVQQDQRAETTTKLENIIKRAAKTQKVDLVLRNSSFLYADNQVDLTEWVIDQIKKEFNLDNSKESNG